MTELSVNIKAKPPVNNPLAYNQFMTDGHALEYLAKKQRNKAARRQNLTVALFLAAYVGLCVAAVAIPTLLILGAE